MNHISTEFYRVAQDLEADAMLITHSEIAMKGLCGADSNTRWLGPIGSHKLQVHKQTSDAWDLVELEAYEPLLNIQLLDSEHRHEAYYSLRQSEAGVDLCLDSNRPRPASFLLEALGVSTPEEVLPFIHDWSKQDEVITRSSCAAGISTMHFLPQDRFAKERLPYLMLSVTRERNPTTLEISRRVYWQDNDVRLGVVLPHEDETPTLLQAELYKARAGRQDRYDDQVPAHEALATLAELRKSSAKSLDEVSDFMRHKYEASLGGR